MSNTFDRPGAEPVERAARIVIDEGLVSGGSGFTSGKPIWTLDNLDELDRRYVQQADAPGAAFEQKLVRQLDGASDDVIQLFAELFYLNLVPLSDYKPKTKRDLINSVLALQSEPVHLPIGLDEALDCGVFGGGVGFKTGRSGQIAFLIRCARGFVALPLKEREAALDEPLRFRDKLSAVKPDSPAQRNSLLYLAFPDFYLPIVTTQHRVAIRDSLLGYLPAGSTGDVDQDLHDANEAVITEQGRPVDYYKSPWRERWDEVKPMLVPLEPWDAFIHWATRMAVSIDLDHEERDYKVQLAERLNEVRELVLRDDPQWSHELKKALGSTNLLNRYFLTSLFNDLRDRPDMVREAVLAMWEGEPDTERMDELQALLKAGSTQPNYSPGNLTALGSLLLMSRDLAKFPPYRPTPVSKVCSLTKSSGHTSGGSAAPRYTTLLVLCDEVLERVADSDIELRDRLDAQGLIWAVAERTVPDEWDAAERHAFEVWRGTRAIDPEEGDRQRRAWLVRGSSVSGRDLVPTWLSKSSVSLAASRLRPVEPGVERDELKPVVDEDYAHTSYAARAEKLDEFHAFLSRMQVGDVVATTSQGRLYLGEITGPATTHESSDERSNLRRKVEWNGPSEGVDYAALPADISARLQSQRDVVDLTQQMTSLVALIESPVDEPILVPVLTLPDANDALAAKLHVTREWLQECVELLRDRPQLIFYGPPGTGKTYIAQALAAHLAGDNVKLVQFHPAYSYEDFFEGYRPVKGHDGAIGFELKPGPLRSLVDQAVQNPGSAYVLIIDEINRGNLAKIFGELYFLLEYREKNVDLLYASGDDKGFTLPKNVFVIGTMNTADRSIALVDAAMRRRFAFLSLHPSEPPTNGILRSWLEQEGYDGSVADLLDELNHRIQDADFKIGPSYFMRPAVHADGGLERAWRTAILPLLEEHHYGEGKDVEAAYGLVSIRSAVEKANQIAAKAGPQVEAAVDAPTEPDVTESDAAAPTTH